MKNKCPIILAILTTLTLLTGCRQAPPEPKLAGTSVQGRPIHYYEMGNGPRNILYIATIHGNENAGTPLMHKFMQYLLRRPDLLQGRRAIIMPVMNPDGYAANTRGNANGVDLNRNFPAANRENTPRYGMSALSEPESQIIYDMLNEIKPERIVVMHQPWAIVDWDGPGQHLAQHMARHTIHPEKRIGARPGSLGSYAGVDLQIPIITWELPGKAHERTPQSLWNRYGRSLVAALIYPNDISQHEYDTLYTPSQRTTAATIAAAILLLAIITTSIIIYRRRRNPQTNP